MSIAGGRVPQCKHRRQMRAPVRGAAVGGAEAALATPAAVARRQTAYTPPPPYSVMSQTHSSPCMPGRSFAPPLRPCTTLHLTSDLTSPPQLRAVCAPPTLHEALCTPPALYPRSRGAPCQEVRLVLFGNTEGGHHGLLQQERAQHLRLPQPSLPSSPHLGDR